MKESGEDGIRLPNCDVVLRPELATKGLTSVVNWLAHDYNGLMKASKLIQELAVYMKAVGLSTRGLAEALELPPKTIEPWFSKGKKKYLPSRQNQEKLEAFLNSLPLNIILDASRHTEKVKWLLLLLEDELRWFKDGPSEGRDVLRKTLDPFDAGYVTSLLTMLQDEDAFNRWRSLSTNKFGRFGEGDQRGQESGNPSKSR